MPVHAGSRRARALLPVRSLAALVAAVGATLAITYVTWDALRARAAAVDAIEHTHVVIRGVLGIPLHLREAESGQRSFVITGDEHYLNAYDTGRAALAESLSQARALTADNPEQQLHLDRIEPLMALRLKLLDDGVQRARSGDREGAYQLVREGRGRDVVAQIEQSTDAMTATEQRLLRSRTEAWNDAGTWSMYVLVGGGTVLLAMLGLLGWLASRDFRTVDDESWVRRVQADLGRKLQGDLRLESIAETVLASLAPALEAHVGAVYVTEPAGLRRLAGHGLAGDEGRERLAAGEGLTGRAAASGEVVHLRDVPAGYLTMASGVGRGRPTEVVIQPAAVDGKVQAVVELAFVRGLGAVELDVLGRVSETVAMAVRGAHDRRKLEELLEETQRQSEELQTQQEELRVTNEELEQQSRALQLSQSKLENQQAELEQINAQLEEQTQSLERQRDELARTGGELARANDYKSQFLANMSHELRTPLNSSLILAKLLADNREGNLTEEQIKFAATIYSSGNDLLTLINDILDLSKIEAGMLEVRPEPLMIGRVLDDLNATFRPVAEQKQLELVMRAAPGAPDAIESDPLRLQQILKNLLANALKFTERGGVTLEVTTSGDRVHFAVRDTGIGIPADQHEVVFEAFRQAEAGSTRRFGGTGLGLSISRDLARLLGGELTLDSAPGRGSTFTLSLPRRSAGAAAAGLAHAAGPVPASALAARPAAGRPTAPAAPVTQRAAPAIGRSPIAAGPPPFADDRSAITADSRTLLVVEDDPVFARVLYDLAHELDFLCAVASTAEDGLTLATQLAPSAIVLDVGLPDRSGLTVLDRLKRDPRTRHVPVHVVSGTDHTRAALEMGAAGYALKPVEREQLVGAIRRLEAKFTRKLRRVLVVEDDPLLRDSTARLLSTEDVQVITAGTTADAIALLRSSTFDCMVLDLSLPDRSGLELLEDMARGDQSSFPPVIVYTGRQLSPDQVHELERFSRSIIIKGARSPERLLDEVTLFLHQVESELPPERQRMLRDARNREAVFEGKRILIVEDDVRNVFALSAVLEPRGAQVVIARNGREAIERVHDDPDLDLVLMDIMMPEMDGLQATRALRAEPRYAKLPIIALTAKAMIDDRERCRAAGASDYIAKPLDVDKLLSLARIWIRK